MFIGWERVNYPIIKKPEIERTDWKLNELSKYGNKNLDTPHGFYTRDTFLYSSYWLDNAVKCLLIGLICTPWNFCTLVRNICWLFTTTICSLNEQEFWFRLGNFGIETITTFIHSRSSLKNHTQFQTKSVYPFSDQNGAKALLEGAAYT